MTLREGESPRHPPAAHDFQGNLSCLPCLLRQAHEAAQLATPDPSTQETALRSTMQLLAEKDWQTSPPALSQQIHRLVREITRCADPYATIKSNLNRLAAELYPVWHQRFREIYPPLEAAVRLAIAGNLLDAGVNLELDRQSVDSALAHALHDPLHGSMTDFAALLQNAESILYLADNAGEIIFDQDLLSQLPLGNLTLAVRGCPILNDATILDAMEAGLDHLCDLIPNGSDAPGTILEQCSVDFRSRFESADLIIAKGQGNYETLAGSNRPIAFLL